MSRFVALLLWSAAAAFLVATFAGEDLTVSLRIWLVAFVLWFGGGLLLRVFSGAAIVPSRFRLLLTRKRETERAPQSLHEFRSLESLLLRARENDRTHRQQLRPRLTELADHFLLVQHGINRSAQSEQAAEVLGDVAWLLEDAPSPAPTFEEIDRFLERILRTKQQRTT